MVDLEFKPSKLGTKRHWDSVYATELENFEDFGNEGEVWFGEDSVEKIIYWCIENVPSSRSPLVLEVGSGNGVLLASMVENGYDPKRILGIDYSPDAIRLAKKVAFARGEGNSQITYKTCDFLNEDVPSLGERCLPFDLILDKGTFDAIALSEKNANGALPCNQYATRLAKALSSGGYFLITSCNFTEDELIKIFANTELGLSFHSTVKHPTYIFGGKIGSIVATVAFRKQ